VDGQAAMLLCAANRDSPARFRARSCTSFSALWAHPSTTARHEVSPDRRHPVRHVWRGAGRLAHLFAGSAGELLSTIPKCSQYAASSPRAAAAGHRTAAPPAFPGLQMHANDPARLCATDTPGNQPPELLPFRRQRRPTRLTLSHRNSRNPRVLRRSPESAEGYGSTQLDELQFTRSQEVGRDLGTYSTASARVGCSNQRAERGHPGADEPRLCEPSTSCCHAE
jgi:hypothetical protein